MRLPPYAPALEPVERVWLTLRERWLSRRRREDYDSVVDACRQAWNASVAKTGRMRSLCDFPDLNCVSS